MICRMCGAATSSIKKRVMGMYIRIEQKCSKCGYMFNWTNQPMVNNMPLANLLVSSSILFSGSLPSKALQVFSHLNIKVISLQTFFQHQRQFLQPAVSTLWTRKQSLYIAETEQVGIPIVLGGDGRADSPGYSAKYGSYTAMDLNRQMMVNVELVQV